MRKWTQPQERRKARTGGGEEARMELEELKGSKKKLPESRASSLDLELLRDVRSARADLFALSLEG